jgi:4-hydroxymandelate oxidase
MKKAVQLANRRAFLKYLAASPVVAASAQLFGQTVTGFRDLYAPQIISRAQDAINVFDFEEVAKQKFLPGHYTYMAMGTDSGGTLQANRDAYAKLQIRVRRLVNTSIVDTRVELFGVSYPTPILIAPCGHQKAFHAEGEIPTARAARSRNTGMLLSSVTSVGVEEVNTAYGRPVWYQLYADANWETTAAVVRRVEQAGCEVMVITVDLPISNREADYRHRRSINLECQTCHAPDAGVIPPKPMYAGLQRASVTDRSFLDWTFIERIRAMTSMKIVLKGIVTGEDARLAIERGIAGIIVSNHGGRGEDSGRSTIESLPEVVATVGGRIPVIIDGGIRRGTDIFKALAIGADAVAIGRPYLWGLGSFGQEGVEVVLDILRRELEIIMRQAGTLQISDINRNHIG